MGSLPLHSGTFARSYSVSTFALLMAKTKAMISGVSVSLSSASLQGRGGVSFGKKCF